MQITHDYSGPFDSKKDHKMRLIDPLSIIVGYGNMHNDNPTGTCHGTTIGEGNISIEVIIVNFNGYKLPIPKGDATILG